MVISHFSSFWGRKDRLGAGGSPQGTSSGKGSDDEGARREPSLRSSDLKVDIWRTLPGSRNIKELMNGTPGMGDACVRDALCLVWVS